MNAKLYVGNLAYETKSTDLENTFGRFGTVSSAIVLTDRDTGRSKGFGFVEMSNGGEANAAIEGLNGRELDGRNLVVNAAKPKEDRSSDRGFGGNNNRRSGW